VIEALVFDLDNTLVYLPIDYEKLFQDFGKIMETENVRPLTKTIPKLEEKTKNRIFKTWEKAELEASRKIRENKNGMAVYGKFCEQSKALITLQGRTVTDAILKLTGLSFKAIVTREDSFDRIEQLDIAMQKLDVKPSNVLFVGDSEGDISAARAVGCHFLKVVK
jgi:HAD superfamily hydrolase (TIGR01549 family)